MATIKERAKAVEGKLIEALGDRAEAVENFELTVKELYNHETGAAIKLGYKKNSRIFGIDCNIEVAEDYANSIGQMPTEEEVKTMMKKVLVAQAFSGKGKYKQPPTKD